jgi:hypothetical protein
MPKSHASGGAMLKSGVLITQTPQITGFVGYVYDPAGAIGSRPRHYTLDGAKVHDKQSVVN